jgi:hypothetical protein
MIEHACDALSTEGFLVQRSAPVQTHARLILPSRGKAVIDAGTDPVYRGRGGMKTEFAHTNLERLEYDASFTMGQPPTVVRAYRLCLQAIECAQDERDLRAVQAWHNSGTDGPPEGNSFMTLSVDRTLEFEIVGDGLDRRVRIVGIIVRATSEAGRE